MNYSYKISKFLHVFHKDDKVCLYNALTMSTVYTTQNEWNNFYLQFNKNQNHVECKLFKQLLSNQLIVREDYNEEEFLAKLRNKIFKGVSIRVMVLQMTDYCNLKCKYCFIEGGQPKGYVRKEMSFEIAQAAINKFVQILDNHKGNVYRPSIVFYGGEPLANWKVIKKSLEYIKNVEKKTGFHFDKVIITNGTLLTEEMATIIKRYKVLVSVSIDGIKKVHDSNRVDYNNQGSYENTVKAIRLLQKKGVAPAASCVLAKEGIAYSEESVGFLIEELGIKGLGFNHVSIIPGLNYYDAKYEEDFAEALLRIQELIQNKYNTVYERRLGHKVNMFIEKKLIKSDCTGCGEQISISPTGEIGICQGYMGSRKTFVHSVFDEKYNPEDDPVFKEWSKRSPLNIDKCLSCAALATCGGGCPRNADMIHGSIWDVDTAFCHFAKKAQEWLVWQEIDYENQ